MTKEFKSLNTGDITTGNYAEKEWNPDRDITLHRIMIVERNDYSLSNVQVYIILSGQNITKDYVPASVLGSDPEYCYKPEMPIPKAAKIYVKIQNSSANTINCDVVFEYE